VWHSAPARQTADPTTDSMAKSAEQQLQSLPARVFDVRFVSHAAGILAQDFPQALTELESALSNLELPITETIGSGGGETKFTLLAGMLLEAGIRSTTNQRAFDALVGRRSRATAAKGAETALYRYQPRCESPH
jgi:hypothetical protein